MTDYRATGDSSRIFVLSVEMFTQFNNVMKNLGVNAKRSLEELNGDWTTSMELAETLQRLHGVPFRVGHHFASLVVVEARKNNWHPDQFPYAEGVKLYAKATADHKWAQTKLPLDAKTFSATLSPEMMVRTRVGIGGPQPAEVQRMIAVGRDALAKDRAWLAERNNRLLESEAKLNTAFEKLL